MSADPIRQLHQCIQLLASAANSATLYSVDHPQVSVLVPRIVDALRRFIGTEREQTLVVAGDLLLYQGKPLERDPHGERLATICGRQQIGYLRFLEKVSAAEVRLLLRVLVGELGKEAFREQCVTIRIGDVEVSQTGEAEVRPIASVEDLTPAELQQLSDCFTAVADQERLDLRQLTGLVAGFITAFRREANPFLALAPLRMIDEYTFVHSVDVCILNLAQGMALGLEGQPLHDLGIAGMLHDVGKIFVAREITKKPAGLDEEQWQQMKQHPSRGAQYLLNQPGIPRVAVMSCYEHHMRHDLKGYPEVPPGWQLNLASEMTMISDTYDALRTQRAYKESWDVARAAARMLEVSGSQLHPELTLNFLAALGHYGER